MKKIDIELKKENNASFKFQDGSITIKKNMNSNEMATIVKSVMDLMVNEKLASGGVADLIFNELDTIIAMAKVDMCVIDLMTNINIETMLYDDIVESGLMKKVSDNVYNYNQLKDIMAIVINKHNVETVLIQATQQFADTESLEADMDKFAESLSRLSKENPDFMNLVLQDETVKAVKEQVKKERKKATGEELEELLKKELSKKN